MPSQPDATVSLGADVNPCDVIVLDLSEPVRFESIAMAPQSPSLQPEEAD